MNYLVIWNEKTIGTMVQPCADYGMGIISARFIPTPEYAEVRKIFRLFSTADRNAAGSEQIEKYYRERDGLELSVTTETGLRFPVNVVHIVDYEDEFDEIHCEVQVTSGLVFDDTALWEVDST